MPISYRIDLQESLVHVTFRGEITVDQLRDFNSRLRTDPDFHSGLSELVELVEIQPKLDFGKLSAYRDWFLQQVPLKRSAIIATNQFAYGLARQFATISEPGPTWIQVFRDERSARAWLDLPADSAAP